jgi:signal transduction histidine kinase
MGVIEHKDNVISAIKGRSIARRLLVYIIFFSSFITLIATSIQLYTDFQRDVSVIESRLNEIEGGYLASISASLWNMDVRQLELQMDGIKHLPDIQSVRVEEASEQFANPLQLIRGEPLNIRQISREYPIVHQVNDEDRVIGTLFVQASLTEAFQRLWEKVIVIFFSQGVKTFIVSLFILCIVYYLVTRHLTDIAGYVRNVQVEQNIPALQLQRKEKNNNDELDDVVHAFNGMMCNLREAYEDLRNTNAQLQIDILARQRAEQEVLYLNSVLEQKVRQRTAELEAANKELAAFSYSVSHDLRAPLRRIEGFRRILAEDYQTTIDDKGRHYLSRIEAGTHEMADMIDSFLRLSRTTQGEMDVKRYNISEMVSLIIKGFQEREPERKVVLLIEPDVYADVDKRFFEVMLTNLIDNAWKYSRQKTVTEIRFGTQQQAGECVYYVADKGAGFDMNYAGRLFSPFARLHKTEEFEGTGIGLTTVQRIISRHGGQVRASSALGEGATFYFTLWTREKESGDGNDSASGRQS